MKDSYEIDYNCHKWFICVDFKVIQIVLNLQQGFTKHPCFLSLGQSCASWTLFANELAKKRKRGIGSNNRVHKRFVDRQKMLLPPLHIKIGWMKQYVRALDKNDINVFSLSVKSSEFSDAKIKEGIFTGADFWTLRKVDDFVRCMNSAEKMPG